MKKLLLILFIVLCFGLVACADAQTTESTTTTESTSAVATTVSTTETTTATTETTTATTETTTETTTTEPKVDPIPESFIEFDSNGRPILSPEDKSCFDLVTRTVKIDDVQALIEEKASLQRFCAKLPLQCIRRYFVYEDEPDAEEMFYVTVKTDEGWRIIAFICYPRDTNKIEFSHTQDFVVESKEKNSAECIELLSKETKYTDLCALGYEGTVTFDGSKGQYSGRGGLVVLYVFNDGTAIEIGFGESARYSIFIL